MGVMEEIEFVIAWVKAKTGVELADIIDSYLRHGIEGDCLWHILDWIDRPFFGGGCSSANFMQVTTWIMCLSEFTQQCSACAWKSHHESIFQSICLNLRYGCMFKTTKFAIGVHRPFTRRRPGELQKIQYLQEHDMTWYHITLMRLGRLTPTATWRCIHICIHM